MFATMLRRLALCTSAAGLFLTFQAASAASSSPTRPSHQAAPQDANSTSPFLLAVENHDVKKFRDLLHQGEKFDFRGDDGAVAVLTAAQNKDADMLELLLSHGAPVNAIDADGNTALVTIPLYSADASSLMPDELHEDDQATAKCVEVLCRYKADVNAHGQFGCTSLHWAAQNSQQATVGTLLRYHADINSRDQQGQPPFMALLNNNTLHSASDIFATAKILLSHGAKINGTDKNGQTALHEIFSGRTWDVDGPSLISVARFLIAHGANVNKKDLQGVTPVMLAAKNGTPDIEQLLLAHRANVNARDKAGRSVLGYTGLMDMPAKLIYPKPTKDDGSDMMEGLTETGITVQGSTPAETRRFQTELEQGVSKHNPVRPLLIHAGAKW